MCVLFDEQGRGARQVLGDGGFFFGDAIKIDEELHVFVADASDDRCVRQQDLTEAVYFTRMVRADFSNEVVIV